MAQSSTPGPDLYAMAGQQQLRVKHNSGTMKFGSEERKAEVGPKGPGPGQYKRSNYDVISSKGRVRAAPKFSFGGKNIRGSERIERAQRNVTRRADGHADEVQSRWQQSDLVIQRWTRLSHSL